MIFGACGGNVRILLTVFFSVVCCLEGCQQNKDQLKKPAQPMFKTLVKDIGIKTIPLATLNGEITTLANDTHGTIYVGGDFSSVDGDTRMAHIAYFDATGWHAMQNGISGAPNVIAVNTITGDIYVGGEFTTIAGKVGAIAKWNDESKIWQELGQGLVGTVNAIAFDSDGNVYAGGLFTDANTTSGIVNIAKWYGSSWSAMSNGLNGEVNAIAVEAGISFDTIYAGGSFTGSGYLETAKYMASYYGSTWNAVGTTGPDKPVNAIAVDGTNIYIGGNFTKVDGIPGTSYAALWDGATWNSLNGGLTGSVTALIFQDRELYAQGDFYEQVTKYSDGRWRNFAGIPVNQNVNAMVFDNYNRILFGVSTEHADGPANYLRVFDNKHTWQNFVSLNLAAGSTIYTLLVDGKKLYIGGIFLNAGNNASCDRICMWDGSRWTNLGAGAPNGAIRTMAIKGKYLYVGGNATNIGNVDAADNLARWDGSVWDSVGLGVGAGSAVAAIAVDDASGSYVYVGGFFVSAGGINGTRYLARWNTDSSTWSAMPPGSASSVGALKSTHQYLYVASDQAGNVRRYNKDTSAWTSMSGLPLGNVHALAVDASDNIYAGGRFPLSNNSGTLPAFLGKWNGSAWSTVGDGITYTPNVVSDVLALALSGTALYVGGTFLNAANNADIDKIAKIDTAATPATWNSLDGGFLGTDVGNSPIGVKVIVVSDYYDEVFAAGNFASSASGAAGTSYLAVYKAIGFVDD